MAQRRDRFRCRQYRLRRGSSRLSTACLNSCFSLSGRMCRSVFSKPATVAELFVSLLVVLNSDTVEESEERDSVEEWQSGGLPQLTGGGMAADSDSARSRISNALSSITCEHVTADWWNFPSIN